MKPVLEALNGAFKKLGYEQPLMESHFLLFFIEGISTSIIEDNMKQQQEVLSFLLNKYNL